MTNDERRTNLRGGGSKKKKGGPSRLGRKTGANPGLKKKAPNRELRNELLPKNPSKTKGKQRRDPPRNPGSRKGQGRSPEKIKQRLAGPESKKGDLMGAKNLHQSDTLKGDLFRQKVPPYTVPKNRILMSPRKNPAL